MAGGNICPRGGTVFMMFVFRGGALA